MILSPGITVWISTAVIWEIAIKHAMNPKVMPVMAKDARHHFQESGYQFLPILPAHAEAVEDLPLHHQDPFDRILIAQAIVEPMHLLTHDRMMARYTGLAVEV